VMFIVCLKVIVFFRQGGHSSSRELLVVLLHELRVHGNFGRKESGGGDELQGRVANKLPCQPEERLLEVVIRLRGDLEILERLFSMEGDRRGLHLTLLHINLVPTKNDGDILADTFQITMPVGDVLVGDAGGDVEHDDAALTLNVVPIAKATKFLLAGSVPAVEADTAEVGVEGKRVDLNTKRGNVLLFELSCQVALDESRLSGSTITHKNKLECWDLRLRSHDGSKRERGEGDERTSPL